MTANTLFYIILAIIIIDFLVDQLLDALNARHYNDPVPDSLADVFNEEEYKKSQQYKMTNYRFGILSSTFSLIVLLLSCFWMDSILWIK